jgi:hypothetical protein
MFRLGSKRRWDNWEHGGFIAVNEFAVVKGEVKNYIKHVDHHLAFLAGNRVRLAKPLDPAGGVR